MMEIKLDLDFKENTDYSENKIKAIFWEIGRRLALFDYFLNISPVEVKVRETKKGFHVYVITDEDIEPCPELVVALQLILFSDWKRELFNLRRIILDRKQVGKVKDGWNVLFLTKHDHDKKLSGEKRTKLSDILAQRIIEGYEQQIAYLENSEPL